jgi:hypothetical protein
LEKSVIAEDNIVCPPPAVAKAGFRAREALSVLLKLFPSFSKFTGRLWKLK